MPIEGIVKMIELGKLGIHNMDDWISFRQKNPKRTLSFPAKQLLIKRS